MVLIPSHVARCKCRSQKIWTRVIDRPKIEIHSKLFEQTLTQSLVLDTSYDTMSSILHSAEKTT